MRMEQKVTYEKHKLLFGVYFNTKYVEIEKKFRTKSLESFLDIKIILFIIARDLAVFNPICEIDKYSNNKPNN